LGETHDATLRVLSALANVCRPLGDHEARQQAIRRAIAACETRGQPQQAIAAMLGLALALGEAGQHEQAVETYQRAIEQADAIGEAQLQSQALRNYGLLLAELEREADAEQTLRLAVGTGRRANEDETLGRAQVALGIFLQHHGRLDEAGRLLAEAIDRLEAAHPDAVCARSHLQAVESGASCGCGDMQEALAEAFRRFVLERLPAGLIKELRVEIDEGTFNVHVELASEPTEEEQELLTTTLQHAQQQFRTRLSKGPY
jgi:tetratricopeptide (TPR) repeat protein